MFLLYLIGILCSLVMFAPSAIPGFVKWPVAFAVALLMVFFINLSKKDTVYVVNEPKNGVVRTGLFSPLLIYVSASSYTLGFAMLFTYLAENNMVDLVANLNGLLGALSNLNVIIGLVLIVFGLLIYVLRNTFRKHAGDMTLQARSAWYLVITLVALGLGVYSLAKFNSFDVYQYLNEGLNLYIYFGIPAALVLIDGIINLIVMRVNYCYEYSEEIEAEKAEKRARRDLEKNYKKSVKDYKLAKKATKKARKEFKKAKKAARKEARKEARLERKRAKKIAKKVKLNTKKAKKQLKKEIKVAKKVEKVAAKKAKKQAKNEAKRLAKEAKNREKAEKKQAKKIAKMSK